MLRRSSSPAVAVDEEARSILTIGQPLPGAEGYCRVDQAPARTAGKVAAVAAGAVLGSNKERRPAQLGGRTPFTNAQNDHARGREGQVGIRAMRPARQRSGEASGDIASRNQASKASSCMRERRRRTAFVCICETRDSVTPSTSPISRRVRFS